MKTILRKSAIATSLILALAATSFNAQAQKSAFGEAITTNATVAITVKNAVGTAFVIKDEKGAVVYQGVVKSNKTFYIPGSRLGIGTFSLHIGNVASSTFQVN